jgi:hypothetical protein
MRTILSSWYRTVSPHPWLSFLLLSATGNMCCPAAQITRHVVSMPVGPSTAASAILLPRVERAALPGSLPSADDPASPSVEFAIVCDSIGGGTNGELVKHRGIAARSVVIRTSRSPHALVVGARKSTRGFFVSGPRQWQVIGSDDRFRLCSGDGGPPALRG